MPTYLPQLAQATLPAGGTRLHRAILRQDLDGIQGWTEAGADPWAMSAPLPNTVVNRFWPAHKKPLYGRTHPPIITMPAIALAVLMVNEQTWPTVRAWIRQVDLRADTQGWVALALVKSAVGREVRYGNTYADPHKQPHLDSNEVFTTLLEQGMLPPVNDQAPDNPQGLQSFWAEFPATWRDRIEAHHGRQAIHQRFLPGRSPLDRNHWSLGFSSSWVKWLEEGMPLADPQQALRTWIQHASDQNGQQFVQGLRLLQARGADLQKSVMSQNDKFLTAAGWACKIRRIELARLIQTEQGWTLQDGCQGPGSFTPIAEALRYNLETDSGIYPSNDWAFLPFQAEHLFQTSSEAKGLRQVLRDISIPAHDRIRLVNIDAVFDRWLKLVEHIELPDEGLEQGEIQSTSLIYLQEYAKKIQSIEHYHHWAPGEHLQLEKVIIYAKQSPSSHATDIAHSLMAQNDVWTLSYWAPALIHFGAPKEHFQAFFQTHLGDTAEWLNQNPSTGCRVVPVLQEIGIEPGTPGTQGKSYWDDLRCRSKIEMLHFDPQMNTKANLGDLNQIAKVKLEKIPVAAWFDPIPTGHLKLAVAPLEHWMTIVLAATDPDHRLTQAEYRDLTDQVIQTPEVSSPEAWRAQLLRAQLPRLEEVRAYCRSQVRLQHMATLERSDTPKRPRIRS